MDAGGDTGGARVDKRREHAPLIVTRRARVLASSVRHETKRARWCGHTERVRDLITSRSSGVPKIGDDEKIMLPRCSLGTTHGTRGWRS